MKVFELAKKLKVQTKEIINMLKDDGEAKVNAMTNLSDEQIEFVKSEYETVEILKKEAEEAARVEAEKLELARIEAEKIAEEKAKAAKTDADYKPDEMIPCRSIYPGVLIFNGDHTSMVYTFNGIGDRRNIEYQDLKAGMLQQKPSMFDPKFIIEDENLINDERWVELKAVYDSMYDEKDIKKIMDMPARGFEEAFVTLPISAKNTIITMVATQIENGTFEQYNKANIIDKVCGTDLQLKLTMKK